MNYGKKGLRKKQRELNSKSTKWSHKIFVTILQVLLVLFIIVGIIGASAGIGVFKGVIATAPDISDIDVTPSTFSTFVYDNEGAQIAKLVASNSNRIPVNMDQIPQNLADAFVAIEDSRFYEHNGIDIKGIFRAAVNGVKNKFKFNEGASTITQQLIKNSVFPDFVSEEGMSDKLKRKIQEQYLAIQLEKSMDKKTILLNYMNTINLGQSTLGVQAASLRYFDKDVSELTLSECAVIAAITQNPSKFNPISHASDNADRREKVLNNMKEQGYITQEEYDSAMADDVYSRIQTVNTEVLNNEINSYFVDALTDQLYDDLIEAGYSDAQAYKLMYSGGLQIYSTMDSSIQSIVDSVYTDETNYPENTKWLLTYALTVEKANGDLVNYSSEMYRDYFKQFRSTFNMLYNSQEDAYAAIEEYKAAVMVDEGDEVLAEKATLTAQPQVSISIEDQATGYIVALYGGRGEKTASKTLNRATDTVRQPGSTFKVLSTYAPALDCTGLTLATVFNDAPFYYDDGAKLVSNYDKSYRGLTCIRDGIRSSINVLAVKTLTTITPQLGFDYLQQFGLTSLVTMRDGYTDIQQSLALGGITDGVKNIELNAAYATIANGGMYNEPTFYTKVLDHEGNVILDKTMTDSHVVLKETTAFLLTSAMVDVVTSGTGTACNLTGMSTAGKTGTTSDYNDVWFAGFTPYYTATTWAGYDNNAKLTAASEKNLAKTMWKKVMSQVHENLDNMPFTTPAGIVQATVCSQSGKLPIEGLCDGTLKTEYFEEGTVPTETCDVHYQGDICQYDNLPASAECPFKINGVVTLIPVEPEALQNGSATRDEEGNITSTGNTTNYCQHNAEFFANPDYQTIINNQAAEIANR